MAKAPLSRKAALVKGALSVHLAPKMAQDAKLDFGKILEGVTAKSFAGLKPEILTRIKAQTAGKLAQDATLDDVNLLLDRLDSDDSTVMDDEPPLKAGEPPVTGDAEVPEEVRAILEGLKDKLSPEEYTKLCTALSGAKSMVVGDDTPTDTEKEEMVSKPAMDAAIATAAEKAAKAAEASTIARLNAVREAENMARPYIGSITIAQDTAEGVYRFALDAMKVDHAGITEIAGLKALLLAHPKPGERTGNTPRIAQDSASVEAFAKRFPDANRLAAL